jgi:hypothetical protein
MGNHPREGLLGGHRQRHVLVPVHRRHARADPFPGFILGKFIAFVAEDSALRVQHVLLPHQVAGETDR